ncbi:hypothetical protein K435DRAFT_858361 [Dendrothele bispora CBS 962.96]|uniref:Uncharacterized protein n=1 Tax=Dendrothele bispora (strain CBS 962.96) TaxID=1314807 RepID=A0A4S8M3D0_DENBC|nr:hypothetical protein K435DRAFT_858361 [Dendrothele bispora CBS 962.96]
MFSTTKGRTSSYVVLPGTEVWDPYHESAGSAASPPEQAEHERLALPKRVGSRNSFQVVSHISYLKVPYIAFNQGLPTWVGSTNMFQEIVRPPRVPPLSFPIKTGAGSKQQVPETLIPIVVGEKAVPADGVQLAAEVPRKSWRVESSVQVQRHLALKPLPSQRILPLALAASL